ncbi:hypothetical protein KEJ26_04760 [Candidatus Bathyarchaeota archaeon]|nr:hypothetical protein [Candidatus Bathyarchaeota archaeon]
MGKENFRATLTAKIPDQKIMQICLDAGVEAGILPRPPQAKTKMVTTETTLDALLDRLDQQLNQMPPEVREATLEKLLRRINFNLINSFLNHVIPRTIKVGEMEFELFEIGFSVSGQVGEGISLKAAVSAALGAGISVSYVKKEYGKPKKRRIPPGLEEEEKKLYV